MRMILISCRLSRGVGVFTSVAVVRRQQRMTAGQPMLDDRAALHVLLMQEEIALRRGLFIARLRLGR